MTAAIWFWIIYGISLVFGGYWGWAHGRDYWPVYGVLYILVGLLGWGLFGAPIR